MANYLTEWLNSSQFEMSGWEIIPGALLLLFLTGGFLELIKARSGKTSLFKERRSGSPRKRLHIPMTIETPVTQSFSVKTYDISLTGAFIPLFEMKKSMNFTSLIGKRSGIKVGDLITLKLQVSRFSQIHCQGRVIRFANSSEQLEGIGIQFVDMAKRDQKKLEDLLYDQHFPEVI